MTLFFFCVILVTVFDYKLVVVVTRIIGECRVKYFLCLFIFFPEACIVLFEIFAVDFLFYICCTHIRVQFKLLQRELELLIPGRGKVEGLQIKEKLTDLIKWHQVIMR